MIATLQLAMNVPLELQPLAKQVDAVTQYEETNNLSLDGHFVRLAFREREFATVNWNTSLGV